MSYDSKYSQDFFFGAIQSIMNSPTEEKDNHPVGFTVTALKIEDWKQI